MLLLKPWLALFFGIVSFVGTVAALMAFSDLDGLSTDLSGKLIAPLQPFIEKTAHQAFKPEGFRFGEEEAYVGVAAASVVTAIIGFLLCCSAAQQKRFSIAHGTAFLFSTASLILAYFELGYLFTSA